MKKVLLLIAFIIVSCKNDEINRPNILFIMSDDHTSQSWGIYGGILKDYVKNWNDDKNLVFVTHYVVISEALNYAPSSGEIVIADKNFKKLNSIEIDY